MEETMTKLWIAGLMAVALTSPALAENATTPAVSDGQTNADAPVPGANSFTEDQARSRVFEAGYTDVSGLTKDDNGIWRGKASKDGTVRDVQVDFQGNVTSE